MEGLLLCDRIEIFQNYVAEFLVELRRSKNLGIMFLLLWVMLVLQTSPSVPLFHNHIDRSLRNDYHNFRNLSGNSVFYEAYVLTV